MKKSILTLAVAILTLAAIGSTNKFEKLMKQNLEVVRANSENTSYSNLGDEFEKIAKHNKNRYNLVIKSQHIQKIQTILESKYEVFDIKKELYNAQSQLQKAKLANDVHIASLSIIKHTLSQSTLKLKEFFKDDIRKLKNILSIIENINIEDQNLRQLMIDTTQDLKNMHDNITILQFEDILIQMIDGMENLITDQNQNLDSKAIVFDNTKISLCKEELLKFYTIQKQRDYLLGIEIADILHNDESDAITIY